MATDATRWEALALCRRLLPEAERQAKAGKPRLLEHVLSYLRPREPHVHLHPR
jgi:hypothetical protein